MHISKESMPEAVRNISRVVKPGGRLLISVPSFREDLDSDNTRDKYGRMYNNFQPSVYVELFKLTGFKVLFQEENRDAMKRGFNWITIGFKKI